MTSQVQTVLTRAREADAANDLIASGELYVSALQAGELFTEADRLNGAHVMYQSVESGQLPKDHDLYKLAWEYLCQFLATGLSFRLRGSFWRKYYGSLMHEDVMTANFARKSLDQGLLDAAFYLYVFGQDETYSAAARAFADQFQEQDSMRSRYIIDLVAFIPWYDANDQALTR